VAYIYVLGATLREQLNIHEAIRADRPTVNNFPKLQSGTDSLKT